MKKQLSYFIIASAVMLLAIPAMAANLVTTSGNVIEISSIDSDWTWSDTITKGINITGVKIN